MIPYKTTIKFGLLFLVFFIFPSVFSQNQKIENNKLLHDNKNITIDTVRITTLYNFCRFHIENDTSINRIDSTNNIILGLTKKNNFKKGYGYYYYIKGLVNLKKESEYNQALACFFKAQNYFNKLKIKSLYLELQYNIALSYIKLNQGDKGKKVVFSTLNRFQKSNYYRELSNLYSLMGNYFIKIKNKEEPGANYLLVAIDYAKKDNSPKLVLNNYFTLIEYYKKNRDWKKTYYFTSKATNYLQGIDSKLGIELDQYQAINLTNSSLCNYFLNNFSDSYKQANKSLHIANKLKDVNLIYTNNYLLSLTLYESGKYHHSLQILNSTLKKFPNKVGNINYLKGKCYFKLHNYLKADSLFRFSISRNQSEKNIFFDENSIIKDLEEVSIAMNNYKSAYLYSKKYYKQEIEKIKTENKLRLVKLDQQYNDGFYKNQNNQLIQIKKNNELELESIKKNNTKSMQYLLLVVIAYITLLLYISKYIKTNSNLYNQKKELEAAKLIISNSLTKKEVLLIEMNHRIKNNLQMIISILNIQAREINNDLINTFLEEQQNRIAAIALLHEHLYQNEEKFLINFKNYLDDFLKLINNSITINKINFNVNVGNLMFPSLTVTSLGLIINELIVNSIKYAFEKYAEGTIFIEVKIIGRNRFQLIYRDSGLPFKQAEINNEMINLKLINLLVLKINGEITKIDTETKEIVINFYNKI